MAVDYGEDFLQRIVGVHWRKRVPSGPTPDVIVVFLGQMVSSFQTPIGLQPTLDGIGNPKVQFLRSWRTPYQAEGFQPGYESTAYKVSSGAGEIMITTAPGTGAEGYGTSSEAYVFAIENADDLMNIDAKLALALDRAEAGVKLIVPAQYMMAHSSSDIPYEMCPPGLLWGVSTAEMFEGATMTWKIRYGAHRAGSSDIDVNSLPNLMVQCYPLGPSFAVPSPSGSSETSFGYAIYGYRLDKYGTGTVYGRMPTANDEPFEQRIDPMWNQETSSVPQGVFSKGILFQDPPPLIGSDQS